MNISISIEDANDNSYIPSIKLDGKEIWRSKKTYHTPVGAREAAEDKIDRTMKSLFSGH